MWLGSRVLRRWRRTTQVQRVVIYTNYSLYLMLCALPAAVLTGLASGLWQLSQAVLMVLVLSHAAVGLWLLREGMRLYPNTRPLPGRQLMAFVPVTVATGCAVVLLPDMEQGARNWVLAGIGYVSTLAVSPLLRGWTMSGWMLGTGLIAWLWQDPPHIALFYGLLAGGLIASFRLSLWLRDVVIELDRNRSAQSALAVAEERLRFARDLHDVLGRNLSTIAVKSELATELGRRADERSPEQMLEVRELAHDSLREVRELARGYRSVSFDAELDGAHSLLESAGIATTVDLGTDGGSTLSAAQREMAAWVVREATTNVLRHSDARECTITLDAQTLSVTNDGASGGSHTDGGTGLAGLRERLRPAGALLRTACSGDAFTVTVEFQREGART